jgi:hypothetical protein
MKHILFIFTLITLTSCSLKDSTAFRGHEEEFQSSVLTERQTVPLKNNKFKVDWRMTASHQTVVYVLREDEVLMRITYPVPDDVDFSDLNYDGFSDITFLYGKVNGKKGTWHLLFQDDSNSFKPAARIGEIPNLTKLDGTRYHYTLRFKCGGKTVRSTLYYFGKDKIIKSGRVLVDQCANSEKRGLTVWKNELAKEKLLFNHKQASGKPVDIVREYWKKNHAKF